MRKKSIVMFMTVWVLLATVFPQNANAYSFRDLINDALNIVRMFFGNNRGVADIIRNNRPQERRNRQPEHEEQHINNILRGGIDILNMDNSGIINIYN